MLRQPGLLLLVLLASACATNDPGDLSSPDWQAHNAQLQALQQWRANGKLALRDTQRSESATLDWYQDGLQTRVQLRGPLGVGATQIISDGKQLEIQRDGEVRVFDISSREQVLRHTGWDLPLGALPYWLRGLPDPTLEVQALQLDETGALPSKLSQAGWRVSYEDFTNRGGLSLPTRLRIESGDTRATVVIRQWRTGAGT